MTDERLREALEQIAGDLDDAAYPAIKIDRMRAIARAALAATPEPTLDVERRLASLEANVANHEQTIGELLARLSSEPRQE